METRNVTLTLEKAKEFYNSGNAALKEVALQAFTKEELEATNFENITCFGDAVQALGLDDNVVMEHIDSLKSMGSASKQLVAIYMLNIVRKALNGGEIPSLVSGSIYYPWVRFYAYSKKPSATELKNNNCVLGESFTHNGNRYILVGGSYACCYDFGVGIFCGGDGSIYALAGLLCCKSREIAQHMSKHFSKLIFEAVYGQYNFVEWE